LVKIITNSSYSQNQKNILVTRIKKEYNIITIIAKDYKENNNT